MMIRFIRDKQDYLLVKDCVKELIFMLVSEEVLDEIEVFVVLIEKFECEYIFIEVLFLLVVIKLCMEQKNLLFCELELYIGLCVCVLEVFFGK